MIAIATKRKTTTSTEVKRRYNEKTYRRYQFYLRQEEDAQLIDFIEANKETHGTTEIIREGLELLKEKGL